MKRYYVFIKHYSRFAPGNCTITVGKVINHHATQSDLDSLLALPETYDGEREETISDLESMGTASYRGITIDERG